jgi:hypothetical protein
MDWLILLAMIAVAAWWIYRKEQPQKLSSIVFRKWVEIAQVAVAATDAGNGAALVGKSVTVLDFTYEFCGVPPMLRVSVLGTGSYLGFRGNIANDGRVWVWVEKGGRSGAKKLVAALCASDPDIMNGNKFSAFGHGVLDRFADPNVPLR